MKEKNPVEALLMQIADIISTVQNYKGPLSGTIPPEVLQEIERLEKAIAEFDELNKKGFSEANIDIDRLRMELTRSPSVDSKDKQLIQRAKDIEKDAKNLQMTLSKAVKQTKVPSQKKAKGKEQDPKQKIKERRKRFKPLGGDKNWIPL